MLLDTSGLLCLHAAAEPLHTHACIAYQQATVWLTHNYIIADWVIDLDGGSATRSNRSQFIKRMVQLAQTIEVRIRLVYYPPYHSKYNPIERCWAVLENYWNGAILDSITAAVRWASHMTWKGIAPIVHRVETTYQTGVKVLKEELEQYTPFWHRSETLPKWDIMILPN